MTKGGIKERNWARECGRAGAGVGCVEREVRSRRRRWKGREILGRSTVITRKSRNRGRPLSGSLVEFYASAFGPLGSGKKMASERLGWFKAASATTASAGSRQLGFRRVGLHGLIRSPPQHTGRHLFPVRRQQSAQVSIRLIRPKSLLAERPRTTMH
jgi:hypothetical protein